MRHRFYEQEMERWQEKPTKCPFGESPVLETTSNAFNVPTNPGRGDVNGSQYFEQSRNLDT